MIIPKAIEILELNLKVAGKKMPQDVRDSVSLAIEALKVVKANRDPELPVYIGLLPGETKD